MWKASIVNVLSIWEIQLNSDETFYNVEAMASWGWFNALSAFRPTFNLMASAGRSSTGNNDFFFWFQLQKCPCCVIYWCFQKLKHSDAWIEVSSVLSFLAHCVKKLKINLLVILLSFDWRKLKINLLVILLSFDWRTDSWWDVFQWFVPITRPLSVSFLLCTYMLGRNR